MKTLDLGCGNRKIFGADGLDKTSLEGVDIVHDLNVFPYPIDDNSYDRIVLRHVVEHMPDIVGLMEQVHRIGKPEAFVEITTPHYTSCNSYIDPTHVHHFSLLAFNFFCGGTTHDYVAKSIFRMEDLRVECFPLHDKLPWISLRWLGLGWLARKHPIFYERFLAFLFPINEFCVKLKIVK